jgi:hypothetical protein
MFLSVELATVSKPSLTKRQCFVLKIPLISSVVNSFGID